MNKKLIIQHNSTIPRRFVLSFYYHLKLSHYISRNYIQTSTATKDLIQYVTCLLHSRFTEIYILQVHFYRIFMYKTHLRFLRILLSRWMASEKIQVLLALGSLPIWWNNFYFSLLTSNCCVWICFCPLHSNVIKSKQVKF